MKKCNEVTYIVISINVAFFLQNKIFKHFFLYISVLNYSASWGLSISPGVTVCTICNLHQQVMLAYKKNQPSIVLKKKIFRQRNMKYFYDITSSTDCMEYAVYKSNESNTSRGTIYQTRYNNDVHGRTSLTSSVLKSPLNPPDITSAGEDPEIDFQYCPCIKQDCALKHLSRKQLRSAYHQRNYFLVLNIS